jgi:hypothetical protein
MVGLVFLDDLHSFDTDGGQAARWAAEQDRHGPLLPPSIFPPPVTVVVARWLDRMITSADWLGLASRLVVVLDLSAGLATALDEDREMAGLEREELFAALGRQVAFYGGRCKFNFVVLTANGPAFFTPSSHDWPSGHGKKLYGGENNDPVRVELAPDAGACLSTYEHDTLLTPGLPLRWRDVGGLALAKRAAGEPRALLFCRSDGEHRFPGDPFAADEDARDVHAVVSLGPSEEARYVVGLEAPTYRLAGGRVERLGGPGGGFLVCDAAHRVVRRGQGRLLGGNGAGVVVEREGMLLREDVLGLGSCPPPSLPLASLGLGAVPLGPASKPIAAAVPVPGSANVVLISLAGGIPQLRMV